MTLLPLNSLLSVPLEGLTLVVDNARSPANPVSAKKSINKRRRPKATRAISWDGASIGNRWASAPTALPSGEVSSYRLEHAAPTRRKRVSRQRRAPQRASSAGIMSFQSQAPVRKPTRQLSPIMTQRKTIGDPVKSPTSVADRSMDLTLMSLKMTSRSTGPMRIPQRHRSPKVTQRKTITMQQSEEYKAMSTAQLLSKALEEIQL